MTKGQLSKLFRDGIQFNVNELQAGQGSGLGLYIAKDIKVSDARDGHRHIQSTTYFRILIVDDAATNHKLLRWLLQNHRLTITEAGNGQDDRSKEQW
jgi:hypothetical protein